MGKKSSKQSEFIKNVKMTKPNNMEYTTVIPNAKARDKYVKRVERVVRQSMEYRDYIAFLKEHMDLDSCIFFLKINVFKSRCFHQAMKLLKQIFI